MTDFMTLISENFVISLIIIVFIGSLLGEITREIDDNTQLELAKLISSWIKSCFGSVILGLMLQAVHIPSLFLWALVIYTSFLGHTKSFTFIDDIFIAVLNKVKDKIVELLDK